MKKTALLLLAGADWKVELKHEVLLRSYCQHDVGEMYVVNESIREQVAVL